MVGKWVGVAASSMVFANSPLALAAAVREAFQMPFVGVGRIPQPLSAASFMVASFQTGRGWSKAGTVKRAVAVVVVAVVVVGGVTMAWAALVPATGEVAAGSVMVGCKLVEIGARLGEILAIVRLCGGLREVADLIGVGSLGKSCRRAVCELRCVE